VIKDVAPARWGDVPADAPGRQVALPGLDVFCPAGQVIDDPAPAEAAAEPLDRRERLLGRDGGVVEGRRILAEVADAADAGVGLSKVAAHGLGPAGRAVQHGEQLAGLAHLNRLDLLRHGAGLQTPQRPGDVRRAIQGDAVGGFSVAAGAADLLPVGLQAARRIGVDDEADVGLIDPHAEGDGRDHDGAVLGEEAFQPPVALGPGHAGVIGDGVGSGGLQGVGDALAAVAAAEVDDAGLAPTGADQFDDVGVGPGARGGILADGRELKVRPGEAVDEDGGAVQMQGGQDVVAGAGVGGRGDGDAGNAGEELAQPAERAVVRAEIVTPLADAVGLVDGDEGERGLRETIQQGAGLQAFGRDVEQVQIAGAGGAQHGGAFVQRQAGIEPGGADALLAQGLDLVGHEGDQGRDDQT
jgi:hypothetical protein